MYYINPVELFISTLVLACAAGIVATVLFTFVINSIKRVFTIKKEQEKTN
jgi:hypothetical protein